MHTPEQIETWARDGGLLRKFGAFTGDIADLTRFAALVAQHERERCQAVCEAISLDLTNDVHVRLGAAKCHADILRAALADLRTLEAFDCAAAIRNSDGG